MLADFDADNLVDSAAKNEVGNIAGSLDESGIRHPGHRLMTTPVNDTVELLEGDASTTSASPDNRTRSDPGYLTLTVGPGGEIDGTDDRTLQAGVDYLNRLGGGVLRVLPGTYEMGNSLYLHPGIILRGAGEDTVLRKRPSSSTAITRDSDWYENRVTVADVSAFHPGCGIMLRSYTDSGDIRECVRDTVVAVDGHELTLSRRPEKNFWLEDHATAATLFPLVTAAEHVCDVVVEDLVLDGNRNENEEINGNYSGAVFLQQCHRFHFRRVTARNYHGDGFSFQICDDMRFDACRSEDNANLGFHPGSGSQRPVFSHCISRGNSQGIFFCWGVTDGLVDECDCSYNLDFGASIGHRDTDNRVHKTRFKANHKVGLLFRKQGEHRAGHRNLIEHCEFVDNGYAEDGIAVDVRGATQDVEILDCCFTDSGDGKQKIGVRLSPESARTRLAGNEFSGLVHDFVDLTAAAD
ncbi:MAG: right-handed parallel beta-helix repeat-containing protein [Candidatus Latescibacterota bacterium]|nr:right-handed parallel beta-helix repeat-containing protein [Candidatus Latescibacterota bacterium]